MSNLLPFGPGAWAFISVYLLSLLIAGWYGYRARREDTMQDFYLAGSGFGFVVLFLTLYATQYSGNTLLGYSGKAYRVGYSWIMCIHFMTSIVVCYLLYVPRLYQVARKRKYITPADYLNDRYSSGATTLLATVIMIIVLSNYLLAQLMAMGRVMEGLTQAGSAYAYHLGIILLTLIMVIYGTLGGIRAVAWTDAIQGLVLMTGFLILVFLLFNTFGPLSLATDKILHSADKEIMNRALPPGPDRLREWLSYVLLIGLGSTLYPQAMQRVYAAGSAKTLRRSLAVMAFMPLFTSLIAVITGIYALAYFPGLQGAESDQALPLLMGYIQQGSVFGYWLIVLLFAAILAAMMSTADSALLSISSMLSKDIYGRFINPAATEFQLTRMGKYFSWGLIIILIWLAIYLQDKASLLTLLDRKFDLLVQLVPAFMLGIRFPFVKTGPVFIGMTTGIIVSLILAYGNFDFVVAGKIAGFHPGLLGLLVNLVIVIYGSLREEK